MRRVLVDDGGVLEVPQVEHPDRAVGPHRREHVPPAPGLAERDVVDLLVVGDQLGLDVARDHVDAAEDLRKDTVYEVGLRIAVNRKSTEQKLQTVKF